MKIKDGIKNLKNFKYKILFIVLIIGLALSTVFAQQQPPTQKPYTIMVYMNPSDLEWGGYSEGSINMLKMLAAKVNEKNMNIIIEIGGTKEWTNTYALNFPMRKKGGLNPPYVDMILPESIELIPTWFTKEINPKKNIRYKIENGDFKKLQVLNGKNIGEADTLTSFIDYSMTNFPAEEYALVFWGHGQGATRGFGYDENFNDDTLTTPEMKIAFESSKAKEEKINFILFDTCYMANLEVAYTLKNYANYLIASEDSLSFGTAYHKWLKELSETPDMPIEQIAKIIGNSYNEQRNEYRKWALNTGSSFLDESPQTLSVIKLDGVQNVVESLETLFRKHAGLKETVFNELVKKSIKQSSFTKEKEVNHMDLKDFIDKFALQIKSQNSDVEALKAALNKSVIYNTSTGNKNIANGLSIYAPIYALPIEVDWNQEMELYKQLNFASSYTKYVEKVIGLYSSK